MLTKILVVLLTLESSIGLSLWKDQSDWNGLKVTWGINPFKSFHSMPRTKADALAKGWEAMQPAPATCTSNPHFLGERFVHKKDLAVVLIFDPAGYIAGIQTGIPKNYPNNPHDYPSKYLIDHPFVLENNTYFITAYFVNPVTLCQGRTKEAFQKQGTGVGLWIQNGTDPVKDSMPIPLKQKDMATTLWTKGKCFVTMGVHYWYNVTKDMPCDRFFPFFLMYNDGVLNSFGWAFEMNLENSDYLEHPTESVTGSFINPVPTCMKKLGTLTSLHIYLTDSALANMC